jgi:beta-galactosidase
MTTFKNHHAGKRGNSSNNLFNLKALLLGAVVTCAFSLNAAQATAYVPPTSNHADFNFNYDWLFLKSNPANAVASTVSYSETAFTPVSLPHTWQDDRFREWVFDSNAKPADPLRPSGSYTGDAWYRKHFTLPTTYSGRQILLEFQGISYVAHFYVNGQLVGYNESSFGPSGIDITPYVVFGSDNVIAVDVNNNELYATVGYNGDGLPGGSPFNVDMGGINRDVTLHITDKAHLTKPLYRNLGTQGTYIFPTNIDTLNKTATINVQAEVKNDYTTSQTITCNSVVVDATGTQVLSLSGGSQTIAAGQTFVFDETANMTGVHFWDPSFPYLYQVYTILTLNGQTVDVDEVTTGFRTYVFNPSFGLEINGHPVYPQRVRAAHIHGMARRGYAGRLAERLRFPDDQERATRTFMRAMQCAPHLEQVQAADRYGVVMVVPSAYSEDDQPDANKWQEDLDIMRDNTIYFRNDPSVRILRGV